MKKMHIVSIGSSYFAFDSLNTATAAISAIGKGTPVKYVSGGSYEPDNGEGYSNIIELRMHSSVSIVQKPKRLGLPAPKRNSVECPFCESVSVVRGTNCQSCGEYVS